ncbi:MAG: hypothetical protein KAH01_02245, partial [Caldisericia bacterium]|nr:hypothetical protein [Caldisericia bacterium]
YAFGEDETIAYIDSASSRNSAAFISRKKYQYHSSENISDELTLINQYDIENEKYLNICQTHEASEMISVGISDTKVYLLEILHGDEERCTKDIFSVYTIDQETGKKIGRADIVMRTGEYLEPEGNGLFYIANEYFPGNLEAGYGIMYYNEESLYKPHGYHDLGVQKKMKIMTSCNNLMPCSQYIESGAFREEIEQDEVLIHIIGIDWISNNKIAFTYTTYEERPEWRIEIGEYFDHQGLIYHIDIIDLSAGPIANAFDTLNFRELELDIRTKCHSKHEWIVSRPHSLNGKRLTCTDKYIAVPVELSPVSFEKEIHKESVIALFDRTTLEYVSFIELGKDLNKDESISIVRPDDITICNDSEPIYIDLKMNAEIIDITSDCSQIAVSYIMSYGHENNTDEDQVDEGAHSFMYIEVFEDTMETKECHKVRIPVCDRAKSRDWKVGI